MLIFLGILSIAVGIVAGVAAAMLGAPLWLSVLVFLAAGSAGSLVFVVVMMLCDRFDTASGPDADDEIGAIRRKWKQLAPSSGRHDRRD